MGSRFGVNSKQRWSGRCGTLRGDLLADVGVSWTQGDLGLDGVLALVNVGGGSRRLDHGLSLVNVGD